MLHVNQNTFQSVLKKQLRTHLVLSILSVKHLAALAFVPPQNVVDEFVRLIENSSEVLDVRVMSRNRRKSPRISISMWNCFSRVHLDLPRTNNALEGWHNAFHNVVGDHPSCYKFINNIKREEHNSTVTWNQVLTGTQTSNKRKKGCTRDSAHAPYSVVPRKRETSTADFVNTMTDNVPIDIGNGGSTVRFESQWARVSFE
ncbi:unnamed protein product [Adineta ricciae]|uniref:Uncharacterized protein n=1 Tax=Adineta ricciae TaxID=249248 RepID=A0A815GA63_ADIRI|nr:unnamed protein product [Adineta ricciae]CAF1335863.1 unnamed protein product [Adineta ricciae]